MIANDSSDAPSLRFSRMLLTLLVGMLVGLVLPGRLSAAPPAVDFARDVYPLLQEHCIDCHGADSSEGDLRLDARAYFLQGGVSGRVVVPGDADRSLLWRRVIHDDAEKRMPLDADPLQPSVQETIRRWIDSGAEWPAAVGPQIEVEPHWAYQPIVRPTVPDVENSNWPRNPIDAFLLHRMRLAKLQPAPPADRVAWLRRVYLDLIGVPPTPQQVDDYLNDDRPGADGQVVDRLLSSPRYGERWARPWLDLARYADSNGYQADQFRSVWPYRDWVIRSINRDQPFDQFTIWQLAGDLLPDATVEQRVATGFARLTTCNVEAGVDPEENRIEQLVDRVNTVSTVWLGTTMTCAQCHEHKYDPFEMRDYYQLLAYFNNTPIEVEGDGVTYNFNGPWMTLPQTPAVSKQRQVWQVEVKRVRGRLETLKKQLLQDFPAWHAAWKARTKAERNKTPAAVRRVLNKDAEVWNKKQRETAERYYLKQDPAYAACAADVKKLDRYLAESEPDRTLVMIELSDPRETHVMLRGDYHTLGERVEPGTPESLPRIDGLPANRLGLARWLVSPGNPLTARVVVNRWWFEFWGRGIVATLEDFGTRGDRPTHPELLDYLASELIESGWSRKHVHRLIVLSAAYRQAAGYRASSAVDPENRWYARGPRVRLPAETVRDHLLASAGLLSDRMGGPPVYPPQPPGVWRHVGRNAPVYEVSRGTDRFRRGIYVVWRRSAPYPSFVNFDAPDRASCVVKRSQSNTPLQALTLMNDQAYAEAAMGLVERVFRECGGADDEARLSYAFRCCVARVPTAAELGTLTKLLHDERTALKGQPQKARRRIEPLREVVVTDAARLTDSEAIERAAWWLVANVLMNLDEVITK